ncbi:hypothetical protein Lal_00012368 [Lupinus albus]|nr:hypothetical protein Lal_00012368 [Lupinus albus]
MRKDPKVGGSVGGTCKVTKDQTPHSPGKQMRNDHFDKVLKAVNEGNGGAFFLYGYGGTVKTFIWKTLASTLRSENHIVLTVTTHSKLAIPAPTLETLHATFMEGVNLQSY